MDGVQRRRSLIREVNGRIRGINASFAVLTDTYSVLCECGNAGCFEHVEVPARLHEEISDRGDLFVLEPNHVQPTHERVVESTATYALVLPSANGSAPAS